MSYITTFITTILFYTFYYSVKYFDNRIKYKSREFYNFIIMLPNSILYSYKIVLHSCKIEYSILYLSNFF